MFWPAWLLTNLGLGVSETATRFIASHPALYLTAEQMTRRANFVYIVVCLTLALIVMARNYQRLRDAGSRRRIRWVVAALMIALIPYMGMLLSFRVADWISESTYRFYLPVSFLAMLCIPTSIAAAHLSSD